MLISPCAMPQGARTKSTHPVWMALPLLLLVEVGADFDTSPLAVLRQILQPGILAQNRPSRVAVLTTFTQESKDTAASKNNTEVQIRFFSPNQRCEANAWLLAFATPHSLPPILD